MIYKWGSEYKSYRKLYIFLKSRRQLLKSRQQLKEKKSKNQQKKVSKTPEKTPFCVNRYLIDFMMISILVYIVCVNRRVNRK